MSLADGRTDFLFRFPSCRIELCQTHYLSKMSPWLGWTPLLWWHFPPSWHWSATCLYMYISIELLTWSRTLVAEIVSWHEHVQFGAVVHGFFHPHLFGTFGGVKRCCKWNGGWCVCYNRCIIWVLDDIYFSTWASGETDHHIRIGTYICLDVGSNNSFLGHHIAFYRCKFPHFLNISW
mgnify:CR=1 FL=1